MSDTIFHKILAGEIPCAKIYEDDNLFFFLWMSSRKAKGIA